MIRLSSGILLVFILSLTGCASRSQTAANSSQKQARGDSCQKELSPAGTDLARPTQANENPVDDRAACNGPSDAQGIQEQKRLGRYPFGRLHLDEG